MYFLRRLRPLEVAGERVRSLRVSLNSPVLSAADLPVGPARAVIVVHREPRGRWDASVGVRSSRGGEVAYWSFDGELTSDTDLDVAADAALTFSESLGFLFDEQPLGAGADAEKAFRGWLTGAEDGADADAGATELVLDEAIVEEPAPAVGAPARPPAKSLSKFRGREASANSAPPAAAAPASAARKTPARQPLAKLQLVKRRSPEEERRLLLRRLITSF